MSNQEFLITVDGTDYFVGTGLRSFSIHTCGANRVITDQFGDCNPLVMLWGTWKYQTTHGAARTSMELKCLRLAVEQAIEEHREWCLDQLEATE